MQTETQTPSAALPTRNGSFVWFELRAKDPEKSGAFFAHVVGWKRSTMPIGGQSYTLLETDDGAVGGVVQSEEACFTSYVSVDDVDDAARRVERAGGEVLGKPYDAPTVGRMVEVKDPDGAAFHLFKAERGDPPAPRAPGAFLWNELWARDDKKSLAFLTSVLGYVVEAMPMGDATYHMLSTGEGPQAGVLRSPVKGLPPSWLPYIHVDNVDATVARAEDKGGALEGEVTDMPGVGRLAVLRAPDGCRFAVMKPAA